MAYSSYRNNRSPVSLLSRFIVAGGGAGGSYRYTETTYSDSQTITDSYTTSVGPSGYSTVAISVSDMLGKKATVSGYEGSPIWQFYDSSGNTISMPSGASVTIPTNCTRAYIVFTGATSQFTVDVSYNTTVESTSSTSGKSSGGQQGGGTSGCGQYPGTQTSAGSNGAFGFGANQTVTGYRYSGGGSGFVNTAANASSRPSGYTGLQLDSGTTTAGNASFPSTSGGTETGHSGNGYAKIIRLNDDGTMPDLLSTTPSVSYNWTVNSGTWNEGSYSEAMDGIMYTCSSPGTSGSTVIRCTFSGVSSITFRCRYQGESSYDYLTVGTLDASCTRSAYGTSLKGTSGTWKDITFNVSDKGEHYVEFCYSKGGSVDTSPDNANVMILSVT